MALNGVNLPLAFNGLEEIWRRVWTELGLTQEDLDKHFTGPAFLPWLRMGNMRGFAGPLTPRWHKKQVELQHRILDRMRGLGMTPVLPAFGGQVPEGLMRLHPNSSYSRTRWMRFPEDYSGTFLLSPLDPLFKQIGSMFIREQTKEFGTDHFYNCDTFNEMNPPNKSASYLASVGRAVYEGMAEADPHSVWIMQGWLFLNSWWEEEQMEAYLTAVPRGKMLLLDLDSPNREQYTRTKSYYGQPFIFNMIHTFGGAMGMFGRKNSVNSRPFEARSMENSSMVGTGFTMEGIHNSYVMYDLLSEMSWRREPISNLTTWFQDYARRRYGKYHPSVSEAWAILAQSVYNVDEKARNFHGHVMILRLPGLKGPKDIHFYDVRDVIRAWSLFIQAAEEFRGVETFLYDLVDLTRQALANIAPEYRNRVVQAYKDKSLLVLHENALVFLDILEDLDRILATNKNFLLGPWLQSAKDLATSESERKLYEFNARNQITLWGPDGQIMDYGGKQWSGLVTDYYVPRWELFFKELESSIISRTAFDEEKFRKTFLEQQGRPFCENTKSYPTNSTGDTIEIAKELYSKWSTYI